MIVPLVYHSAVQCQCSVESRVCVRCVFVCVRCVSKMERLANNLGQSGHISLTYLLGAGSAQRYYHHVYKEHTLYIFLHLLLLIQ